MARPREQLHQLMCAVEGLADDPILEDKAVYYQPPPTTQMHYPCIRYELDSFRDLRADDKAYVTFDKYNVIVIDRNPDSTIPRQLVMSIPMCTFDRRYVADNLYHNVLTIYY